MMNATTDHFCKVLLASVCANKGAVRALDEREA